MRGRRLPHILSASLAIAFLVSFPACDDGVAPEEQTPVKASDWVSEANWDAATTVTVTMKEESANSYVFEPNVLSFEAGKPYILQIVSPAANQEKHYFATEGAGDFYKAIATRKIQTSEAEYKAPHFEAVEMKTGGTALEIYFVAVLPGTYDILCTIPGHKALGMTATATITGGVGFALDLEIASDFDMALSTDPRKSGGHAVWNPATATSVTISETPYGFVPTDLALTMGVGYRITIQNPAGHASKHYYTAADFYKTVVTRKAEDSQAEIKSLYFNEIELLIGGETELFMVPTEAGTFETLCTITGHADLGMKGTIVVSSQAATPVLASEWVSEADWAAATTVTVTMKEESANSYVFEPNVLSFEAGKPYILQIVSPAANQEKHYFATEGAGDFYKAIATRKIQTSEAEYKAPHFEAVEMKTGGTALEIYFVAVLPGTYDILCTIPGHKALGMTATATITGGVGFALDLEIASDFDMALSTDPRKSGGHAVWNPATATSVTISETPYGFVPTDLALTMGVGYRITIQNPAGHASKHYYTAADFYKTVVTRKAEDSQAEIKSLYFNEIELLIGGQTELFMVPTVAATFETLCTITGHAAAGMIGTIVVS